jgi:hypothetical protein
MAKIMTRQFTFKAKIWKSPGAGGWHFVSMEKTMAAKIRGSFGENEEGWGRLKVLAGVGNTQWETAIWYDTKAGTYLLPIKAQIRKKLKLGLVDENEYRVQIL